MSSTSNGNDVVQFVAAGAIAIECRTRLFEPGPLLAVWATFDGVGLSVIGRAGTAHDEAMGSVDTRHIAWD